MTEQEQKRLIESLILAALKDSYFKKLKQEVKNPSVQLDHEINILHMVITDLLASFKSPKDTNQ